MSNTGDNGSWDHRSEDIYGRQPEPGQPAPGEGGQDPYGPPQPQDPYGQTQPDPWGQPSASEPPGQPSPHGQPGSGYGQQFPGYGPAGALSQPPTGDVGQSRLLVGLLGIFLGAFGVHRFLMGYTTIGIIQACITVLSCGTLSFISGIWGLIEGIMVLAKSEQFQRDAHGRPLTD